MAASISVSIKDISTASAAVPPSPLQSRPNRSRASAPPSKERDIVKAAREVRRMTKRRKDKACVRLSDSEQANAWALDAGTERLLLRKASFAGKNVAQRRSIKGGRLTVTRKTMGSHARKRAGRHRDRSVAGEF